MEDGFAPLDGCDPTSGKRSPVSNTVHLVQDRDPRVAGTEKVGVQGMHRTFGASAIGHGPSRRDEGLCRDLSAEDAQALVRGAAAPVQVDLEGFQVEQVEEIVEGGGHGPILPPLSDSAGLDRPEVTRGVKRRTVA